MKKLLALAVAMILALGCMSAFAADGPIEGVGYPELPDNTLKLTVSTILFSPDAQTTRMQALWQQKMEEYLGVKLDITWQTVAWDDWQGNEQTVLVAGEYADINSYSQGDYIDSFVIVLLLEFNEDGTYRMCADPDAIDSTMEPLKASVVRFYEDFLLIMICDTLEEAVENQFGVKKDDMIYAALEVTLPEFVDSLFSAEAIAELFETMSREGRYSVEPGKLHLSAGLDEEPGEGDYESFTMDGGKLTLTDYAGTSLYEGLVYPMSFTRVG